MKQASLQRYLVYTLVGLFIFGLGFASGTRYPSLNSNPLTSLKTNELLVSQQATFQGKINRVEGDKLQVTSTQDKNGTITLSKEVRIYPLSTASSPASASADIKDIALEKPVIITLVLVGNEYLATSLTYLPTIRP